MTEKGIAVSRTIDETGSRTEKRIRAAIAALSSSMSEERIKVSGGVVKSGTISKKRVVIATESKTACNKPEKRIAVARIVICTRKTAKKCVFDAGAVRAASTGTG